MAKVSGVSVQVSAIEEYQITNTKQTIMSEVPNSKHVVDIGNGNLEGVACNL
jgi:hypothetical protein